MGTVFSSALAHGDATSMKAVAVVDARKHLVNAILRPSAILNFWYQELPPGHTSLNSSFRHGLLGSVPPGRRRPPVVLGTASDEQDGQWGGDSYQS